MRADSSSGGGLVPRHSGAVKRILAIRGANHERREAEARTGEAPAPVAAEALGEPIGNLAEAGVRSRHELPLRVDQSMGANLALAVWVPYRQSP